MRKYTDVTVDFHGTKVDVRVRITGPGREDWIDEGIYCDSDLTELLQNMSAGDHWMGYDRLMDMASMEINAIRRVGIL